ncbi:MAG: phenylalanine--tRNA ligase subunit beta [bacterium]
MLISLEWLSEYVDIKGLTPEQIAHELTMSGLEVEEIEKIGAKFTNIVVAEIKGIKPHPQADKLQLVEVFNGTETREVVCGARNIEVGQIIPYASVGSQVSDKNGGELFTLKPAKIRGVESQGMLCSAEELGLETKDYQEDDGILILNRFKTDLKCGIDVKSVLGIAEDTVLHIAPTANRGDLMSILGVAREISAIFSREFKYSEMEYHGNDCASEFKVEIKDEDTCKYYATGLLKDVKIGESPEWMVRRLQNSGIRSISNVVDITNYVMIEYGQPLHAFDFDKIGGNYLCVRRANDAETIVTLDEVQRKMTTDSVVIAKEDEAVALAGVMGGFSTEIDDNTHNIVLESAYFTPATNRKSARSVGHRTDACARFERGVDIERVKPALIRAMGLMAELCGAKVEGVVETGVNKLEEQVVTLRFGQITRLLGLEIPVEKCVEILENLGFTVQGKNEIAARFVVPSYRANDVSREIDLIEEISRIYGYDKVEPTLPKGSVACEISFETNILEKINEMFIGTGFNEIVTSSLMGYPLLNQIGIECDEEKAVKVTNPQSEEYTMLRQSLIPSILNVVKNNLDMGQKDLKLFEVGKTYFYNGSHDEKTSGVNEQRILAGVVTGNKTKGLWKNPVTDDFYSVKGMIESLLNVLGIAGRVDYSACSDISYMHPGRTAKITLLGKGNPVLGFIGELHPLTADKYKINQPVYLFEINFELLINALNPTVTKFKSLPQYPTMSRDIAFIADKAISFADTLKVIKKAASNILRETDIFDVYEGKHVPQNKKSVAFRLMFQDFDATLTDEKVDAEMKKVRAALEKAYADVSFRE